MRDDPYREIVIQNSAQFGEGGGIVALFNSKK